MRSFWSLRARIVAAYVLLACAVCGAFGFAAFRVIGSVEDRLIDSRLARTADRLAERRQQGRTMDLPPSVTVYSKDTMPPALRGLGPGTYELPTDGISVNVLIRRDAAGETFALTDNDADFESIKGDIYIALGLAFVACLGLAVVLGRATASRVIAPVTALAQAVEADHGPQDFPLLQSTDEMGLLARAFAARTEALQKFLDRERWFVGDVSHELRTPLTVMLGAAEVLQANAADRPDLAEAAGRIRRTAADTTERVGALLLLSRAPETVGAPRTALEPIIRQEMERCRPLLARKDVTMTLDSKGEVHVFGRPELAGIAIGNLIRNACQFTERGRVTVRLEAGRVVVEDTGVGIPPALKERVFDRFVRAHQDVPTGGSGLGLAIVRRVAEHLGWTVTLEEPPGGGSRFILGLSPPP